MVLHAVGKALTFESVPDPVPSHGQIQAPVEAFGDCRTDFHIVDGDLRSPKLPLILGHEIIGRIARVGAVVTAFEVGQRMGVPWLGSICGSCDYCSTQQENLYDHARFTGYDVDGSYAESGTADASYCFPWAMVQVL